jgi:uncharacterized membrane protein YozB (DUF420 family)
LSCGRCSPQVTPNYDPFDLAIYKMAQTVVSALPWTPALIGCALIPRRDRKKLRVATVVCSTVALGEPAFSTLVWPDADTIAGPGHPNSIS